jgi:hypothetical protein
MLPGTTAATDAAAAVLQKSRRFHGEIRSMVTVFLLPMKTSRLLDCAGTNERYRRRTGAA